MSQLQMQNLLQVDKTSNGKRNLSRLYLTAFFATCFLFWWLPSFYYCFVLHLPNPVSGWSVWVSVLAASLYFVGYRFAIFPTGVKIVSSEVTNGCEWLSGKLTKILFVPAFFYAVYFYFAHRQEYYGDIYIPTLASSIFYLCLFFGLMYLSTVRSQKNIKQKVFIASLLVVFPRIIVSLNYGRLFVAFAILPIIFIFIARGWMRLTFKRAIGLFLLGICIVVVPSVLRGDFKSHSSGITGTNMRMFSGNFRMFVGTWLLSGSTLRVFDQFHETSFLGMCSPLLVSLTEQVIPYKTLGVCTVPYAGGTRVADSDAVVSYAGDANSLTRTGTAATFILDLYWFGGIFAVAIGSLVMGFTCRLFVELIGHRSVFCGIWAECLVRSLFSILNAYGIVYQRIPSLMLATFFCVLVVKAALRGKSRNSSFIGARTVEHG